MEQGKGSMVYYRHSTLAMTQKAGHGKILIKFSLLIDHWPVIILKKLCTIGSAAYWTAITKAKVAAGIKYIWKLLAFLTFGLDFFVILA
jgi:hypothetical protein